MIATAATAVATAPKVAGLLPHPSEPVAVGTMLCVGTPGVGEALGVDAEVTALPQPAASMAASVSTATFREITAGQLP